MPTFRPEEYIYLDYAASAPLCEEALEAMRPYLQTGRESVLAGTNANSLSTPGRNAFKALEAARRSLACTLGAKRPDEMVFTSGATESDNAALFGIAKAAQDARRKDECEAKPAVVVSSIEHDAVLSAASQLAREGFDVRHVAPDRDGFIEARRLEEALGPEVVLVSVQTANSEIGSIQQVAQLADVAHSCGAYFHTDATQALGKAPVHLEAMGVDAASFSSHKVGGPKGIGALYIRNGVPFFPSIYGGGQESGKRSGTQDICGAAGFAAAAAASVAGLEDESLRLMRLRDRLYADLASFDRVLLTVDVEEGSLDYLPNIVNVMVPGIESETLVLRFDSLGFAVSGGSACSSSSLEPSHVLTSLGIKGDDALCELRISMGRETTRDDVNSLLRALPRVLDWE